MTTSSPRLLVPIAPAALVVTSQSPLPGDANQGFNWIQTVPQYANLSQVYEGDSITPEFQPFTHMPAPGVYLRWAMPDALTHGLADSTGAVVYPKLPNRWFVLRAYWDANSNNTPIAIRSWVICSDTVRQPGDPNVPYPTLGSNYSPCANFDPNAKNPWAYIGLVNAPNTTWTGDPSPVPSPLYAHGAYGESDPSFVAGDPTFAASFQSSQGVFGLYDDCQDIPTDRLPLTYMVAGWYSSPTTDSPLLDQSLDQLHWSLTVSPPSPAPTDVLLHGVIHTVQWPGQNGPIASGVPEISETNPVTVALGNTTAEAVSALIQQVVQEQDPDLPRGLVEPLLDAVQYGAISDFTAADGGGTVKLEERMHTKSLMAKGGGTSYSLSPAGANGTQRAAPLSGTLPEGAAAALASLNAAQADADQLAQQLDSVQDAIAYTWQKRAWLSVTEFPSQKWPPWEKQPKQPDDASKLKDGATTLLTNVLLPTAAEIAGVGVAAQGAATGALGELDSALGPQSAYTVAAAPSPSFYEPNAPVVALGGAAIQTSLDHGADGRFDAGNLQCRTPNQVITELDFSETTTITASQLSPLMSPALFPPATLLDNLPDEITDLITETMLRSKDIMTGLSQKFALSGTGTIPPNSGLAAPSPVADVAWTQSWIPLFLLFAYDWFPSSTTPEAALSGWQLTDAARTPWQVTDATGATDWQWTGPLPTVTSSATTIQNRVLINPSATVDLAARVADLANADGLSPQVSQALSDISTQLKGLTIVAQALTGLNSEICSLHPCLQLPALPLSDTLAPTVQSAWGAGPTAAPRPATELLCPIRAGHLQLLQLYLVDAFGQAQPILLNGPRPGVTGPFLSQSLTPLNGSSDSTMAELPVRISQASRLRLEWDDSAASGTPIAGWLLVNQMDKSLMIYDAGGNPLGALQLIGSAASSTGAGVRWIAPPGINAALGATPALADPDLQAFVAELLALGAAGSEGLQALLTVCDESMWTINPLGGWQDQNLGVLIGRPLALARARLSLELSGLPAVDQSWKAFNTAIASAPPPGTAPLDAWIEIFGQSGAETVQFPVLLGDTRQLADGLIGYFIAAGTETFALDTLYLAQDALITSFSTLGFGDQTYVTPSPTLPLTDPTAANVTLALGGPAARVLCLLDPRGAIHARTGILPMQKLTLPADAVSAALSTMAFTFVGGPVLRDPERLTLPTPAARGDWAWLSQPSPGSYQTNSQIGKPALQADLDPTPQVAEDGWLIRSGGLPD